MKEILAAIFGGILVATSLEEAFVTVLLPRPVRHRRLLVRYFFRITWAIWSRIASRFSVKTRREGFLGIYGPLAMVLLFTTWAIALIIGFGFLQWAAQVGNPQDHHTLLADILISGDVFFTLGYETLQRHSTTCRLLTIFEAGTGFGFIALSVSYLPVLYLHFSERDRQLIQLGSRAGSPASAGSVLQRFAKESDMHKLNDWLRNWELWAAELIESHSSYPMLAFYRSQHENHSWLASLAVILDCCALVATGAEKADSLQLESTFVTARRVLVEITRALKVREIENTHRFTMDVISELEDDLKPLGLRWTNWQYTEQMVLAIQVRYEPMLQALSAYLLLPLPKWAPGIHRPDSSSAPSAALRLIHGTFPDAPGSAT